MVTTFIKAKHFTQLGHSKVVENILHDAGLMDDYELLYQLECIFADYQILESKKKNGR